MSLIKHLSRSDEVARDKEKHTISGLVLVPAATVMKQNEAMRVMWKELSMQCQTTMECSDPRVIKCGPCKSRAKVDEIFSDSKEHRTSEGER
jgi:hypothetical protein